MRVASSTRRSTAGRQRRRRESATAMRGRTRQCPPCTISPARVTKPSPLHVIGSRYYGPDRNYIHT